MVTYRVSNNDVPYTCGIMVLETMLGRETFRLFGHMKRAGENTVLGVLER